MFWRHEIQVPPGFEAVVNGRIDERKPLRVGTYDQVYFVNFAPFFATVSSESACKEGLVHKVTVVIKLELQRGNLTEILRDAGHAPWHNPVRVSTQELVTRQNLLDSVKASIQTYTHSTGFFDLVNQDSVRQAMHQRISSECTKARLLGEVVACDVVPVVPESSLLAQLAARAGIKETIKGEIRTREYSDSNLGAIVEYFLETLRQSELIQAETERAKADAERARVDAQKQIAIARADVKIVELEQENRISARQAELQEEDAKRQQAAQERNASIKESGAAYEFTYKSKRLDEEMALAQKELEIAKVKDAEEAALRERKRLDMQIELEREHKLAQIRAEEKAQMFAPLGELLEKLREIPATDYKGVHTLITTAGLGGMDSKELATGLVLGLLSRAAEGVGIPSGTAQSDRVTSSSQRVSGTAP